MTSHRTATTVLSGSLGKPPGVRCAQWGSTLLGLSILWTSFSSLEGTASLHDFSARGGFVLMAMGTVPLMSGICLWRDLSMGRALVVLQNVMLLSFAFLPHGSTNVTKFASVALVALCFASFPAWYFYHKPNVRTYFHSQRKEPTRNRDNVTTNTAREIAE